MLNGIRDKGLSVLNWTPEAEQFRLRLQCAANWLSEYNWPAVDEDSLLATLESWLLPHERCAFATRVKSAKCGSGVARFAGLVNAATSG